MSKKKSNSGDDWQAPPAMDDTEYAAYCFVLALARVAPKLDKGEAYNVIMQWFVDGMTEETAEFYGDILAKLVYQARVSSTVH